MIKIYIVLGALALLNFAAILAAKAGLLLADFKCLAGFKFLSRFFVRPAYFCGFYFARVLVGGGVGVLCFVCPAWAQDTMGVVDNGDTAWVLISAALVMLMTPGLAFFYAGMVSRKNVVSTLIQNYAALAVVGLLWVIIGYSLFFSAHSPFIGGLDYVMLNGLAHTTLDGTGIPSYAFMAFQVHGEMSRFNDMR